MSASTDSIVSLRAIFTVPEGKLEEFKSGFAKFYENTSAGTAKTGSCLYYGFGINENTVICREAYKTAKDVLIHVGEVNQELTEAIAMVGNENFRLEVFGPEAELEKLKEPLAPFKNDLYVLDEGSMTFFKAIDQAEVEDNHVVIVPFFTVILNYLIVDVHTYNLKYLVQVWSIF